MHGDDELGRIQGTTLLGVCEIPYPAEDFIGQPCAFEDLFSCLAYNYYMVS